ncbi:MAG: hypothetical protein PHR89_04875 [Bacilli bacterium]|nr:hypothetical protein [Bacilli bacterium]
MPAKKVKKSSKSPTKKTYKQKPVIGIDKKKDRVLKAKTPGWRISEKTGKRYFENRENRSDTVAERKAYKPKPKKIKITKKQDNNKLVKVNKKPTTYLEAITNIKEHVKNIRKSAENNVNSFNKWLDEEKFTSDVLLKIKNESKPILSKLRNLSGMDYQITIDSINQFLGLSGFVGVRETMTSIHMVADGYSDTVLDQITKLRKLSYKYGPNRTNKNIRIIKLTNIYGNYVDSNHGYTIRKGTGDWLGYWAIQPGYRKDKYSPFKWSNIKSTNLGHISMDLGESAAHEYLEKFAKRHGYKQLNQYIKPGIKRTKK